MIAPLVAAAILAGIATFSSVLVLAGMHHRRAPAYPPSVEARSAARLRVNRDRRFGL